MSKRTSRTNAGDLSAEDSTTTHEGKRSRQDAAWSPKLAHNPAAVRALKAHLAHGVQLPELLRSLAGSKKVVETVPDDFNSLIHATDNTCNGGYEIWCTIGSGGYSQVFLGRETAAERGQGWVAVKEIGLILPSGPTHSNGKELTSPDKCFREIMMGHEAGKRGLSPVLRGCWKTDTAAYLAHDLMCTTLDDIVSSDTIAPTRIYQHLVKLLQGVGAMDVYYRDLQFTNFMTAQDGSLKLIDWGVNGFSAHKSVTPELSLTIMRIADATRRMKYIDLGMDYADSKGLDISEYLSQQLWPQEVGEAIATLPNDERAAVLDRIATSNADDDIELENVRKHVALASERPALQLSIEQFQASLSCLMMFDMWLRLFVETAVRPPSSLEDGLSFTLSTLPDASGLAIWAVTGGRLIDEDEKELIRTSYNMPKGWPEGIEGASLEVFDRASQTAGSSCTQLATKIREKREL